MVKRFLLNNVCDECGMAQTDEPRGFVDGKDYDALAARLADLSARVAMAEEYLDPYWAAAYFKKYREGAKE